jgi:hypothetical protein
MSTKTAKKGSVHQSIKTRQRQGTVGIVQARQHTRASQRVNIRDQATHAHTHTHIHTKSQQDYSFVYYNSYTF